MVKMKTIIYPKIFVSFFIIFLLLLGGFQVFCTDNSITENSQIKTSLISWAMNIKFIVLKDNFYSNIMFTSNHRWLNYTGESSIDDSQNAIPFSDDELVKIHAKLLDLNQNLSTRGIIFYLIIPPNKNTIYPDDLDRIAPKKSTKSRLDQLIEYERLHSGVDVIDIRPELLAAKKTHQVFFSTDTHWNDYGSWVAYTKIINAISKDFVNVVASPIEYFNIGKRTYSGDLAKKSGNLIIEETTQTYSLQNPRNVKHENLVLDNGVKVIRSYIDDPDLPVALIFRDSFYTNLHKYISQHFSNTVCLWSFVFDYDQVEKINPDLVMVEITERYINQLLKLP